MIKIATILTCFNRKAKSVRCLKELFRTLDKYNQKYPEETISLAIYLTDDASSDGTADAVAEVCKGRDFHLCLGDGNCFWAGGMRLAWREALKQHKEWDFYLLLNDDTIVKENVFEQLTECHQYALSKFGKGGLYSGITCSMYNPKHITYGGKIINAKNKGWKLARPTGAPQQVDNTQANILLVSKNVVEQQGIFYDGYIHAAADEDYSMKATKDNIPVLVTSCACGYCEYDHMSEKEETLKLIHMTLAERKKYVFAPVHSDLDYLLFIKRNMPQRYLISRVLRLLRLYSPRLYYWICISRGLY